MGRVEGKVAFITGAARGQGRSHAVRLAQEGADIVAVDICQDLPSVPYPVASESDLAETVKQVEQLDRRIVARPADVRDLSALQRVVDEGLSEFGHIDVVCANAGILSFGSAIELDEDAWQDVIDVNLTGVWKTVRATAPSMVERGQGGSIILTSSVAGLVAYLNFAHYVSAKHGVTGLMRALAAELAPHMIRVNSVHPTTVDTPMVQNPALYEVFGMPGAGGFVPYAAHRMAMGMAADTGRSPRDILTDLRGFYFDTALSASPSALPSLLAFARPDRILFGSDWPFAPGPAVHYFAGGLDEHLTHTPFGATIGAPPSFRIGDPIRSRPERRAVNAGETAKIHLGIQG